MFLSTSFELPCILFVFDAKIGEGGILTKNASNPQNFNKNFSQLTYFR